MVFEDKNQTKLAREGEEGLLVEALNAQQVESFKKMTSFAGTYALIDQDHVLCSQYSFDIYNIEQQNLEVFSISRGESIKLMKLT